MADKGNAPDPANDEGVDLFFGLSYRTYTSSGDRDDSNDYIIEMKADILGEVDQEPGRPQTEIHLGSLKFSIIRVGCAINDEFPLYDLFDVSQEICDLAGGLYGTGFEEFKGPIVKRFPDASPWDDILYFQNLELHPFARGQRVGLSALHRAAKDWESGCGLVVIQPHPLQYPNGERNDDTWRRLGMDDSTPDFKTSKKKLENYYKQLGFEKAGRSNYMFRCPAAPQIVVDVPRSILLSQSTIDAHARVAGTV
jgi:GNAT superfamily N-acetyltransferase